MTRVEPSQFDVLRRRGWMFGTAALLVCLGGLVLGPSAVLHSYLFGYLFWTGVSLGSLALLMLHHLVGGRWGFVTRRVLEAGTRPLLLMAILFLPLALGMTLLYSWARPDAVMHDPSLQQKLAYLNVPFFLVRTGLYFTIWLGLAWRLRAWSLAQDTTADPSLSRRMETLSGPGLVLWVATLSLASIDWVMSLDPHWYSTAYGLLFMLGHVLNTLALVIVLMTLLSRCEPFAGLLTSDHFHDWGTLLAAFVMLWAYVAFSQYLIVWSGNLSEEITWYVDREGPAWRSTSLALIVFHFVVPFFILLSRQAKRSRATLALTAGLLIFAHMIDLSWLIGPTDLRPGLLAGIFPAFDLIAWAGIGGCWLASFLRHLARHPLLPLHDLDQLNRLPADPVGL